MISESIQIEIWNFLKSWGGGFIFCLFLIMIYVWQCERINKNILLPIYKFLRNICLSLNKNYIAKNIEININSTIRKLNGKLIGYNIKGISIKWIKSKNHQCLLRDNKIIIRMRRGDSQEENFVNISHLLITNSLLYRSKNILSEQQVNCIELYTTKKICEDQGMGTEKYFYDNFYSIEQIKNPNLQKYFNSFTKIDNNGLYISLFLQEILSYGEKNLFSIENSQNDETFKEIDEFIDFLEKFVDRKHGETILEKNFIGSYINFGIVLVANPIKRDKDGMYPYLKYVETLINRGIKNIYLLARGNNIDFLKAIKNHILSISKFLTLKNEQIMKTRIKDKYKTQTTESAILFFENKKVSNIYEKIKVSDLE